MRRSLAWISSLVLALQVGTTARVVAQQTTPREFSCTAFPRDLSEAGLITRYGPNNVKSAQVFGSDDGPQNGTVVFPDDDELKLEVVWREPESKAGPYWVRSRGSGGRWRTPNGITVGMDLRSIERANGRPFRLAALSTEGQGVIRSWDSMRLASADAGGCRIHISLLATGDDGADRLLTKQVFRGREFSSGHPGMQALNPRVVSISVSHDPR